jgi:hypothetical protein
MSANTQSGGLKDMKVRLSTLWLFAMLNYLYADVMTLMDPKIQQEIASGMAGPMQMTEGFLLGAAVLMETAIAMVLLARALPYGVNRWANIVVGVLHTLSVFASLFVGGPPALYYLFFGSIEIACTLLIVWFAVRWVDPARQSIQQGTGSSVPA